MSEKKSIINKKVLIIAGIVEVVLIAAILFTIFYEDPTYKNYLADGQKQLNNKQYEKAIESFGKALDLNPDGAAALIGLAGGYMGMEEYDKAILNLEKAKKIAPNDPAIYDKLIISFIKSENINSANKVIAEYIQTGLPTDRIKSVQPAPTITPGSGSYKKIITVTIDENSDEPVYYTTDGKVPSAADKKYIKPFKLNNQGKYRITAMTIDDNGLIGFPAIADYTIDLETAVEKNSKKYMGTWTDGETTLSITDMAGDEVKFNASLNWIDEVIKTSSSGTVSDGVLSFSYTDNWGNKGTGTIWFGENSITIRFREKESTSATSPGFGKYTAKLYK